MNLTNNTALITGASGGIGEEFAIQLATRQVNLVLVARRAEKLAAVRATLLARHPGLQVEVITADLGTPGAVADLYRQVAELGLTIDILINNAGVGFHTQFVDEPPEAVTATIQLNCVSLADLTARFLPRMVSDSHGLVINVASTAAFQPVPTMAVYGATKAFVLSLTEAIWWETHKSGVRVLALCPGSTETEFFAAAGQKFLTRGRQTPQYVVSAALTAALDTTGPTLVPGIKNKLSTFGHRLVPRRLMVVMAQWLVRPTA